MATRKKDHPEVDGAVPGSVDKIRDILFGGHMQEYEQRFARLEQLVARFASELEERTAKRIDSLEAQLRKDLDRLGETVKAEQEDRSGQAKELGRELKDFGKLVQKQLGDLEAQLRSTERNVRDQLTEQIDALRAEKTDRATLGALLAELAMRLTDERGARQA